MQPRIATLGSKEGVPSGIKFGASKLKPVLPSEIKVESFKKNVDFLSEKEVQPSITMSKKNNYISNADNEEEKLPKFSIESVSFSILNAEMLNKMKVVNVSTKLERDPVPEFIKGGNPLTKFGTKASATGCRENSDGGGVATDLAPSQSVKSYVQMGTTENDKLCQTCKKTNIDCPGHLGEIKLYTKFVHPIFREFLIKVLNCVCNTCSSLLIGEQLIIQEDMHLLKGKNRLDRIYKYIDNLSSKKCIKQGKGCTNNPFYSLSKLTGDQYQVVYTLRKGQKDNKTQQDINVIQRIVNNISQKDSELLGFENNSHPKDMILESLPVIPPCARPYTIREGQVREDHLTTSYDEIVRDNYKFNHAEDDNRRRNIEGDLYFHISHLIDNSDGKYCKSPTEKIVSIKQRIVKKEGLIRTNIMGKRVNFSGRSVIGPDSELKFGEVAIPEEMCKILTIPEKVHAKNLQFIRDLWDKNQIARIILDSGDKKGIRRVVNEKVRMTIDFATGKPIQPKIGWTIERYMTDGDVVLVNRQPTLYKYSMVGNLVKKVPRKNIGIHMTETKMRNADFDGDEINIHVIQELGARVEALTFANTMSCIPDALINSAMIGQMWNGLSGCYIMTRQVNKDAKIQDKIMKNKFTPEEVKALSTEIILTSEEVQEYHDKLTYKKDLETLSERLKLQNVNPLSGKALFSSLLPSDFFYKNDGVVIKNGILIKGTITDKHIGRKGGSIQMSVWKWYGRERAVAFITNCTFLADMFIYNYGLTIGYEDISPKSEIRNDIRLKIKYNINTVEEKIRLLGKEAVNMTVLEKSTREGKISEFLAEFKKTIDKIGEEILAPTNPLNIMADSGAKGNGANTSKITGIYGQVNVLGGRPEKKLSSGKRTLPYFKIDDENDTITSRGFIVNSFLNGLKPTEMYFLSEAARVGVINTALTTAETGSLSHKLVKVMEDVKIAYDGSVRNASNVIYQIAYMDGYDTGEMVGTSIAESKSVVSFINLNEAVDRINSQY